jgi:uncharacterized OsmC-like protein
VLTISAVAEHKQIKLAGINVRIFRDVSDSKEVDTRFLIEANLRGNLTKREKILLFNSARNCDVSKLLSGNIMFQYELKEK